MKRSPIRIFLLLGLISITGALITQLFWLQKAMNAKGDNFDNNVILSLRRVAEHLDVSSTNSIITLEVVRKISDRTFQLAVNDKVDCNVLEYYLRTELSYPSLDVDFNYHIHEAETDKEVFSRAVDLKDQKSLYAVSTDLPSFTNGTYYVVIYFPTRATYIGVKMTIWIFSSFILLVVTCFFVYTIFIILRQFRLVEMQKDFVNNIAHEFKTPISTITISAETLGNPDIIQKPERLHNYVNIIKNETSRLGNQVDRLLQIAKMESDKIELHEEETDLHTLIRELLPNLSIRTDELSGKLRLRLDARQHRIMADRVHLINILYSLVDNAIKYTEQVPDIEMHTWTEGDQLCLSVQDNGIGITEEHRKKIFDKFYRVPTGNIHNVKGFGLGLHYLKLVVTAHKWKIKVESEKNKGSNFIITIPYLKQETANGNN
ncbi:MAG: HAMP domain-containing histidine kinase [Chitinophagaceae bacterium]|nr:HAMP domain-containing histidine kinase [Chitinophagaceae bacterium]